MPARLAARANESAVGSGWRPGPCPRGAAMSASRFMNGAPGISPAAYSTGPRPGSERYTRTSIGRTFGSPKCSFNHSTETSGSTDMKPSALHCKLQIAISQAAVLWRGAFIGSDLIEVGDRQVAVLIEVFDMRADLLDRQ